MLKPWIVTAASQPPVAALSLLIALALPVNGQMDPPGNVISPATSTTAKTTTTIPPRETAGQSENKSAALSTLNTEFRNVYAQARERCSEDTLPLIICYSDHMVLIDKDLRDEINFIPQKYTWLKVVDHVPLVLFVLLNPHCNKPLSPEIKQELDKIKKLVLAARPTFATLGLDEPTLERQYQLIDLSMVFLDNVLHQGTVSKTQLISFCRGLEPMIMKNADQAVAAQLQIMDQKVDQWKEKLGPERFKKVTVIIVSGHMPRERQSCFQYFSKALHVKKEGLQIIYSEGEAEEKPARELVGTHVLDASIGETFFKEKLRMHRDLLSDGAARYLKAHPPLGQKEAKAQK